MARKAGGCCEAGEAAGAAAGGASPRAPAVPPDVQLPSVCGLSCGCDVAWSPERCEGCAAASSDGNSVRKWGEEGGGSGTQPPPAPAPALLLSDVGPVCELHVAAGAGADAGVAEIELALGSCPVSVFKEGKLAGGRLAEGTFPRLCIPCLRLS